MKPPRKITDEAFVYHGANTHSDPTAFAKRLQEYRKEAERIKSEPADPCVVAMGTRRRS